MPQAPVNKEYRTFVQGLITEAGPLTFPENASKDENNFVLNRKGYRSRRLGLDYENSYQKNNLSNTFYEVEDPDSLVNPKSPFFSLEGMQTSSVSSYLWRNINEDSSLVFSVFQCGNCFYIHDATKSSFSGEVLDANIPSIPESEPATPLVLEGDPTSPADYAVSNGRLIIVNGEEHGYLIEYTPESDEMFTIIRFALLVRDYWGVDDGLSPVDRLFSDVETSNPDMWNKKLYNLYNQGWTGGPITNFRYSYSQRLPSATDKFSVGIDTTDDLKFNPDFYQDSPSGSSEAPNGTIVLDVFNRGYSRTLGIYSPLEPLSNWVYGLDEGRSWTSSNIYGSFKVIKDVIFTEDDDLISPKDKSIGGITSVASYSGRLFYSTTETSVLASDANSPNLNTLIFYSQVVKGKTEVGKCYQEGDPSSFDSSDILATDGGFLSIPEVSIVHRLITLGKSLVVIGSNGVWSISGGEGGFTATSQQVNKVSSVGALSKSSIVVTEDKIVFWADSGIYVVSIDNISLAPVIQNLTERSIQSFFDTIPILGKEQAQGVYDPARRIIQWIFNDEESFSSSSNWGEYNRQLNFDTSLGAFYLYSYGSIGETGPYVASIVIGPDYISSVKEISVLAEEDEVLIGSERVVVNINVKDSSDSKTKYLSIDPSDSSQYTYTYSELNNPTFLDWESEDNVGVDSPAFLQTGYEIAGDTQRRKNVKYITTHMERTESGFSVDGAPLTPSSCLMKAYWDFADTSASGKISSPQQIYRLLRPYIASGSVDEFEYGQSVITTKNKVRGRGRALNLRFETEAGKDCILYGWGSEISGNIGV
jgi:hypothetical protein